MDAICQVPRLRFAEQKPATALDWVAAEEPLEIRVQGVSVAVLMRTPGHDEELATGFLLTERIVACLDEVRRVAHCDVVEHPEAVDNVIQVQLCEGVSVDLEALRRNLYASSSCGICGKATLENALRTAPPLSVAGRFSCEVLYSLPARLAREQPAFEQSGGLHAAALFDDTGALQVVREDVGRHNAVDKVIGHHARAAAPLGSCGLLVSGRISFEIVQKAAAARIPLVAGISAPTSLAVELAEALGITLVGFLRARTLNVYAGAARITP